MDTPEKRVLRRKKQNICANFTLSEEYVNVFKKRNLITNEIASLLKGESTNAKTVERFLEWLPADITAFRLFCNLLEDPGQPELPRYQWLADELRAELKYERDDLVVDEHVEKECSILVFREFGSSKRLSKPELKQLEKLVSRRTQCAREIWRTPLMKAIDNFNKERDLNYDRDCYLQTINNKTENFVRVHKTRLKEKGKGMKKKSEETNGEVITENNNTDKKKGMEKLTGRMLMEVLEGHLNSLLELTAQALLERDGLAEEKNRALRILDLPEMPNTKLDVKLREAMEAAEKQLTDAEKKLRNKDDEAASLEEELFRMRRQTEGEIENKERRILDLQQSLKASKEKVSELQAAASSLEREVGSVKSELKKYKQRAEMLERNRRIGYIEKPKSDGSLEKSGSPSTRLPTISNGSSATSRTSSRGAKK